MNSLPRGSVDDLYNVVWSIQSVVRTVDINQGSTELFTRQPKSFSDVIHLTSLWDNAESSLDLAPAKQSLGTGKPGHNLCGVFALSWR